MPARRSLLLVLLLAAGGGALADEPPKAPEVGKPAPAFRLNDHTGKAVAVGPGATKAWTVLAFYPKAMTPGCTQEVCSLRDASAEFEKLGVLVYGVSTDDVASAAKFVEEQKLGFPLLSDPDGSATAKYGALMRDRPFAMRYTFVLDPEGTLRHADTAVRTATHGPDLLAVLRRLRGS
jgi:peroxiredoxin Q/BCP